METKKELKMTTIVDLQCAEIVGGYAECRVIDPINPMTGTGPTFPPPILSCD